MRISLAWWLEARQKSDDYAQCQNKENVLWCHGVSYRHLQLLALRLRLYTHIYIHKGKPFMIDRAVRFGAVKGEVRSRQPAIGGRCILSFFASFSFDLLPTLVASRSPTCAHGSRARFLSSYIGNKKKSKTNSF